MPNMSSCTGMTTNHAERNFPHTTTGAAVRLKQEHITVQNRTHTSTIMSLIATVSSLLPIILLRSENIVTVTVISASQAITECLTRTMITL